MKKSTLILIALFIVLGAAAYLVTMKPGEKSLSTDTGAYLVQIDSVAVDRIDVKSPLSEIVLVKKGVEWFVQKPLVYRADQANVANMIHQSKTIEVKNMVSGNQQKHSLFQVDSSGTVVTIHENGVQKTSFVIGKPGPTYSDSYARLSSSNDVALVAGALSYTFNRPVKDWRDKTIFATPRENIRSVEYHFGDTTFTLAFRDSSWNVGKEPADLPTVESLLSTLSKLEADEFVDSLPPALPKLTSTVGIGDVQIRFYEVKSPAKYYVQSSASPQWFEVQPWRASQVLKRKTELLKKTS
jgi:hypothetical protein